MNEKHDMEVIDRMKKASLPELLEWRDVILILDEAERQVSKDGVYNTGNTRQIIDITLLVLNREIQNKGCDVTWKNQT